MKKKRNLVAFFIPIFLVMSCQGQGSSLESSVTSSVFDSSVTDSGSEDVSYCQVTVINGVIDYPSPNNMYPKGHEMTIYANVATGDVFEKWVEEGVTISTENPYTFTVERDITLEAISKTLEICSLTVNGGSGSGEYVKGATVYVTAINPEHQTFTHWLYGTEVFSTEASFSFVIEADMTLDAVFTEALYKVTVTGGSADITEGTYGTTVTLTADGLDGKICTGWLVNGEAIEGNSFTLTGPTHCEPIYQDIELAVALFNQYQLNSTLQVPIGKLYCGDLVIDTTSQVIAPNHDILTSEEVTLNQLGTYEVVYSGNHDGKVVKKSAFFDVVETVAYVSSSADDVVQKIVVGGEGAYREGIYFTLHNEEEVLTVNEPIDISKAAFSSNYLLTQVGFKNGAASLAAADIFEIKMTDMGNPLNYVLIQLAQHPYMAVRTQVKARAVAQEFQALGEPVVCNMTGAYADGFQTNIFYDAATKQIAAGNRDNIIAQLGADEDHPWAGFSSDHIILSYRAYGFNQDQAQYTFGYVDDSHNYSVTSSAQNSYREGITFHLFKDANFVLDGYHITVPTTNCSFFLFRFVFNYAKNINTTIKVKIIDTADANNFLYLIVESLSDARLRFSISHDGEPDLNHLMQTNVYTNNSDPLNSLNIIWNGGTKEITSSNIAQATYGGVSSVSLGTFNPTNVRFELVSNQNIAFDFDYFGDTKNWLVKWQD